MPDEAFLSRIFRSSADIRPSWKVVERRLLQFTRLLRCETAVAKSFGSSFPGLAKESPALISRAPALPHSNEVVRAHRRPDGDYNAPHLARISFLRVVRPEPAAYQSTRNHHHAVRPKHRA